MHPHVSVSMPTKSTVLNTRKEKTRKIKQMSRTNAVLPHTHPLRSHQCHPSDLLCSCLSSETFEGQESHGHWAHSPFYSETVPSFLTTQKNVEQGLWSIFLLNCLHKFKLQGAWWNFFSLYANGENCPLFSTLPIFSSHQAQPDRRTDAARPDSKPAPGHHAHCHLSGAATAQALLRKEEYNNIIKIHVHTGPQWKLTWAVKPELVGLCPSCNTVTLEKQLTSLSLICKMGHWQSLHLTS